MKHLSAVGIVSLLALFGCDNTSRLDKTTKVVPKTESPGASPAAPTKVDRTGSVEDRIARLEDNFAQNAEALDFLRKVYAQQKAQQQQQQRSEPAPDATFAVDVGHNVKGGLVEGPQQALVTVIEAWDFA